MSWFSRIARGIIRWTPFVARVVATRSGKVRRVMGKVDNYLPLVRELEDMARQRGGGALPFEDVRREFGMNTSEAQELVRTFQDNSRQAVVISGVPASETERA